MTEIPSPPGLLSTVSDGVTPQTDTEQHSALRAAAEELEAAFIAEMLKQAKFGEARGAFGGGPGEEQFASFLRSEHADAIVSRGGFGLAESIFNALVARSQGES